MPCLMHACSDAYQAVLAHEHLLQVSRMGLLVRTAVIDFVYCTFDTYVWYGTYVRMNGPYSIAWRDSDEMHASNP